MDNNKLTCSTRLASKEDCCYFNYCISPMKTHGLRAAFTVDHQKVVSIFGMQDE